ncbi:MAG: integrase [Candidatus Omnitrophica bacterium]|nr:integrase [Candidatus Omnitrophota bacterium]
MSPMSKREYVQAILERYHQAARRAKSRILDELCATAGYHRKYAIAKLRALRQAVARHRKPGAPPRPGPRSRYARPEVLTPLVRCWRTAHYPCSKRLKALLPLWLGPYQQTFGQVSLVVCQALHRISPATIDRVLCTQRLRVVRRRQTSTKPGRLLRHQIPIGTHQWDETRPGFLEADTVAHCGTSLMGDFVYTVDTTDLATGWTEQRAVWGKGETAVLAQVQSIEASLPFPLRGFDCDNGSEFLNWHLVRHFHDRRQPVQVTRSRAYHKDDNAHIEQKNWTHVRQWLGYQRFDDPRLVDQLNELYTSGWRLLHNFFLPSVKLLEKERRGSKIVKKHDIPKTPYQRVLDSKEVPEMTKQRLRAQAATLNPFQLREAIDAKIRAIRHLGR